MPDTKLDIKEVVKEKYGQAALRVTTRRRQQLLRSRRLPTDVLAIRSPRISTTHRRPDRFPKRRCWLRSDAAIQRRWRN